MAVRAVILAAGTGSRLGLGTPKCMVTVGEKALLQRQVEELQTAFGDMQIFVVVGFQAETIIEAYPQLKFVRNENYRTTNTASSLRLALEAIGAGPTIWLNADVVLRPGVLADAVNKADMDSSFVMALVGATDEEAVRYACDSHGLVKEISKNVSSALGEAVGINYIAEADYDPMRQALGLCEDGDYFEAGMERAIALGVSFKVLELPSGAAVEVDTPEDLDRAQQMVDQP